MQLILNQHPLFVRGTHFRELSPQEGGRRNRYASSRHVRFRCSGVVPNGTVLSFRDAKQREWMKIDDYGFLLAEQYAWNGCSPKRWVPVFGWIGTLDFDPGTLAASFIHDALYQFNATEHFPLTREQCDWIFRKLIELNGEHEIAAIYHHFVRRYGKWSGLNEDGLHSVKLSP